MSAVIEKIASCGLDFAREITLSDADPRSFGETVIRVASSFVRERGYAPGVRLSDGEVEELYSASRVLDCALTGLKLLAYADNSVRGLERKLRSRGFDREIAASAAELLSGLGYINEKSQIERRGRAIAEGKLRGKRRVAADLCALGYPRDAVSEWLDDCGIDFPAICARAITKKGGIPEKDAPDERRRLLSYLYRQGFSAEDIREALKSF